MLHSRGRVMNDSTLRIRIARFGPSFSLCSLCITVAAQEGASGQSAGSALPVSLLLCCNLYFVVKLLLLFVWAEANFLFCLASLHLRSLMEIHLLKVHAGLRQVTRTYLVIELPCVVMSLGKKEFT